MPHAEIDKTIAAYAKAYEELEKYQKAKRWMQVSDQKTGVIGEYYVYAFLATIYGEKKIKYGKPTEKGWDIKICSSPVRKIQVKTVSGFSKTRRISPIHKGWDRLYLVYLNKELYPTGFWILEDNDIFGDKKTLGAKTCPKPANPPIRRIKGSKIFHDLENRVDCLTRVMKNLRI